MNALLPTHEYLVIALALGVLLADLFLPAGSRRCLGLIGAAGLGVILILSYWKLNLAPGEVRYAFGPDAAHGAYVLDGLALFFKRFFLLAGLLVLLMSAEYSERFGAGVAEYFALTLFALSGMMFAASANDFAMLFVSLELITVTFYILTSFQRNRLASLEAGVKYLVIGALSTGCTVFGIALIFGMSKTLNFNELAVASAPLAGNRIMLFGLALVLAGLGFKISAVPFQIWAPDVYQGAPAPTTAFLAVGSKAAGFALLLRLLFTALPDITVHLPKLLMVLSGASIIYGNLCAIRVTNLKRLLGYSSIAHAGYILIGVAAMAAGLGGEKLGVSPGGTAVLYYLAGYLFTVLGAFAVICLALRNADTDDISALAGLHKRSPFLAATLTLAIVSLAGIPPLAGFFGKFLLFKAALVSAPAMCGFYALSFVAIAGVVVSLYFYFGVIRAIYWSEDAPDLTPIQISCSSRIALCLCLAGMLVLGLLPGPALRAAQEAIQALH